MRKNEEFPQLYFDAPRVPDGLRPKPGVSFGCGDPACRDCYTEKNTQIYVSERESAPSPATRKAEATAQWLI